MDIEIKDGGTYRIYPIRLQGVALNAYGSSATTSGQNVCLYKDTPSDTMQDWIIRVFDIDEGSYRIYSANNTNLVLDRSDGSLRTSRNNNAHLCKLTGTSPNDSEVMITTPAGDSQGHVFIKLKAAINGQVLYLTSTNYSSSDSTPSSITSSMALNTNGNVYWAPQSSETRAYQYWRLEKQGDSGETPTPNPEPSEKITVTNMPYGDNVETFHPDSGMVNGTWAQNDGTAKVNAIKTFYKKVFKASSAPDNLCLYNLFGAEYDKGLNLNDRYHTGIDMYVPGGSDIYSAHAGTITAVGGQFGVVGIYDSSKNVTYFYLHMDVTNTAAKVGETIGVGEFLGRQSNVGTGGQHLHIEVRNGERKAPARQPYINESLTSISPYKYL